MVQLPNNGKKHGCEIIRLAHQKFPEHLIGKVSAILKRGGIIIYPTDTLYGFGVSLHHRSAYQKIYRIKGRDSHKPFSIMINRIQQIEEICGELSEIEKKVFAKIMPGKVTLLIKVRKKNALPGLQNLEKIGFRNPHSLLCRQLVEACACPISSSSVNISGQPNISDPQQIADYFADMVDLIIDAGPVKSLKGSSILDLTTEPPQLVREGEVSREELQKDHLVATC